VRVPMWVTKAGKAFWNGRDDRGHFDTVDRVAEARFHGEDAPHCQHACCKGRRPHPAGRRAGYTGSDFFKAGRRPSVEKWGTDELRAWFGSGNAAAHGRGHRVLSRTAWESQQSKAA